MIYGLIVLTLSLIALGLSAWILLPAPTAALLPLSVGAPEISPGLVALNGLLLVGMVGIWRFGNWRLGGSGKLAAIALGITFLAFLISGIPLSQWPQANRQAHQAMVTALGAYDLPAPSAQAQRAQGLSAKPFSHPLSGPLSGPFSLKAFIRGIRPAAVRYPMRHYRDIPFASPEGVTLAMDIYCPMERGTYPAVVLIYGGAWQRGDASDNAPLARYLAAQGYSVWAISYRHAPQHPFPAQLQDVQSALEFLQHHGADYDTDPTRIALFGKSAGAHLAMLAAYQSDTIPIQAVVNYYGPVDLLSGYYDLPSPDPLDTRSLLVDFLGGTPEDKREQYQAASPVNFIGPNLPATLLIYGDKDHIVMSRFGQALAERLRAQDNVAVFIRLPWADHAFDAVFNGLSNQLALYYTERFLAWALD